jgi:ribosomal protein L12E/L44/L45/RPP1/RPP2
VGTLVVVEVLEVLVDGVEDVDVPEDVLEDILEEVLVAAPDAPGAAANTVAKIPEDKVNSRRRPREDQRSTPPFCW